MGRIAGAGDTGGTADVAGVMLLAVALSFSTLTAAACCSCPAVVDGVVREPRKGKDAFSKSLQCIVCILTTQKSLWRVLLESGA